MLTNIAYHSSDLLLALKMNEIDYTQAFRELSFYVCGV